MIIEFFKKIFGTRNDRVIKLLSKKLSRINILEDELTLLSDEDFPYKTNELKKRINQNTNYV